MAGPLHSFHFFLFGRSSETTHLQALAIAVAAKEVVHPGCLLASCCYHTPVCEETARTEVPGVTPPNGILCTLNPRACFQNPESRIGVRGCTNCLTAVPHGYYVETEVFSVEPRNPL